MSNASQTSDPRPQPEQKAPDPAAVMAARSVAAQLADLAALRGAGMSLAGELTDATSASPAPDRALAFTRVARAVRQIVVLEQEMLDLRALPDDGHRVHANRMRKARDDIFVIPADDDANDMQEANDLRETNDLRERDDLRERSDLNDLDDNDGFENLSIEEGTARIRNLFDAVESRFGPRAPSTGGETANDDSEPSVDARNEYGHDELKGETPAPNLYVDGRLMRATENPPRRAGTGSHNHDPP